MASYPNNHLPLTRAGCFDHRDEAFSLRLSEGHVLTEGFNKGIDILTSEPYHGTYTAKRTSPLPFGLRTIRENGRI